MCKSLCVFLLLYFSKTVQCASILALFSSLSYTDHFVYRSYISLLVQKGHTVVLMTPYPGNFQYPDMEKIVEINVGVESAPFWDEYKRLITNVDDHYPRMRAINELSIKLVIAQLRSKQMTAIFINPNIKFDLVITEADMPVLYAVAEKYNAPHIAITTTSGKLHQHEAKGNPIHPMLYPDVNTLYYRNTNSWQNIIELNRHLHSKYEYYNHYLPLCEAVAKSILGLKRPLLEVEYDIDLLFIASNPSLIGSRPTTPATIYTDGMHINPGLQVTPELKTILDSAKEGVIYFSLGAIQESEQLTSEMLKLLAEAFGELPYKVLWKIGNTTMINKPDNVIAQPWFAQQEILAHPNVKAFITNGGARSLEEALFYEVPIIGFPILKSRKVFINEITRYGAGEILDPYYMEKESFKTTIKSVADDDKYKTTMTKLKNIVNDPILSGPDSAVWWTDYVIRNSGARHLRSPTVGVSFFSYSMLDVFSFLLIIILASVWTTYAILRYIFKRLRKWYSDRQGHKGKFKAL